MAEELDNILQKIINDEYGLMQYTDNNMHNYLNQFELPQCLNQAASEIPKDLWAKIQEFKTEGGVQRLKNEVNSLTLKQRQVHEMLQKIDFQLVTEENEDMQLRAKYGAAYNKHPPSNVINV